MTTFTHSRYQKPLMVRLLYYARRGRGASQVIGVAAVVVLPELQWQLIGMVRVDPERIT